MKKLRLINAIICMIFNSYILFSIIDILIYNLIGGGHWNYNVFEVILKIGELYK